MNFSKTTPAGGGRFAFSPLVAGFVFLASTLGLVSRAMAQANPYTFTTLAGIAARSGSQNGTGGGANLPLFSGPSGLAINSAGNLYVADSHNHLIRLVTPNGVVTTFAGTAGVAGGVDGTGVDGGVTFNSPQGPAVDSAGNLYVVDAVGSTVRKITPAGVVTTLAGTALTTGKTDATGAAARFFNPSGIAVDSSGNIYVADTNNNTIRKVTAAGVVTTLAGTAGTAGSADGTGTAATFNRPRGLVTDSAGNLYVADSTNRLIRKVTPAGAVTTFAGNVANAGGTDGTGAAASFYFPVGLAIDSAGNLYVADSGNNTIRKVTPAGVVATLAGSATASGGLVNAVGSAARFLNPTGLAVDASGNVYVADFGNNMIRKITPDGTVNAVAGVGGSSGVLNGAGYVLVPALFNNPSGTATDAAGNIYLADTGNNRIRKITPGGVVTTFAGSGVAGPADGTGVQATFNVPSAVAVDASGNVYVADTANHTIRAITPAGVVTTFAGMPGVAGGVDGPAASAAFNFPSGVAVDSAGNVYVADYNNNTVRKISAGGVVSTLAGSIGKPGSADGQGSAARFYLPRSVAVDGAGNVYVADFGNQTIRLITPGGLVSTLAGTAGAVGSADGTGAAAQFNGPSALAVDATGNVFVGDTNNSTIRMITPAGVVTTLGGTAGLVGTRDGVGTLSRFDNPTGIAVDGAGNLYIADTLNETIRIGYIPGAPGANPGTPDGQNSGNIDGTQGTSDTSNTSGTGTPTSGSTSYTGTLFLLHPSGIVADASGNQYVTDSGHNSIKQITSAGVITTFAGTDGTAGSADGVGAAASFKNPTGIAIDASGNLYVCDTDNGTIRMITTKAGTSASGAAIAAATVTTVAGKAGTSGSVDGTGAAASFRSPQGIVFNKFSGNFFISEPTSCTIRELTPAGVVTTYAGKALTPGDSDGTVANALFNNPVGLGMDNFYNLYIADTNNNTIRKINTVEVTNAIMVNNVITAVKTPAGTVTTLAGSSGIVGSYDGTGIFALFNQPQGLSVDASNTIYVADTGNSCIRRVSANGLVTTIAGVTGISGYRDGAGSSALFNHPQALVTGLNLTVVDRGSSILRTLAVADSGVSTVTLSLPTTTSTSGGTTTPASGGGGGAPSTWFYLALGLLGLGRLLRCNRRLQVAH